MKHYKVATVVHADGERMSMIIDIETARPDEYALVFLINKYRGCSPNTILDVAESVALTLEWGKTYLRDERGLVGRLLAGEVFSAAEMHSLSEFLRTSRQLIGGEPSSLVVCPETHFNRRIRARDFCSFVMHDACHRLPLSDPRSEVFMSRIKRIETSFADMQPSKPVGSNKVQSLLPSQSAELLKALSPDNPATPFTDWATRIRNRSIVEVMYYTGIRPGELLGLRVQDIVFGNPTSVNVIRREHAADDPRKIPASPKRLSRLMPLSHMGAAEHLREYLEDIRPGLEKRYMRPTSLVFLSIDRGTPLSERAVQKIFKKMRPLISECTGIDGLDPSAITPKCMRHTFSNETEERLVDQGLTEDDRRPILMALRGDSSPRSVDPYIQRTREKRARQHLIERQRAMFNAQRLEDEDVPY